MNKLTKAQTRIWNKQVLYEGANFANIGILTDYAPADPHTVEKAEKVLRHAAERSDAIRTRLRLMGDDVLADVRAYVDDSPVSIRRQTFAAEDALNEWVSASIERSFEMMDSPLYELALLFRDGNFRVFVKLHHIISDGYTLYLFKEAVNQAVGGHDEELDISGSYEGFARLEEEYGASRDIESDKAFWARKLASAPPRLDFSTLVMEDDDKRRTLFEYKLPEQAFSEFTILREKLGTSPFRLATLLWYGILCRALNVEDIGLAYARNGRDESLKAVPGMCVDTIPLPLTGLLEHNTEDALAALTTQLRETASAGRYPLQDMISRLNDAGLEAGGVADIIISDLSGMGIMDWFLAGSDPQGPLSLYMDMETGGAFLFRFFTDYVNASLLGRLCESYCALIHEISKNPEVSFSHANIVPEAQRKTILDNFACNPFSVDRNRTLCEIIDGYAETTPEALAVCDDSGCYTYRQLKDRSDALAARLASLANPGGFVAVILPRVKDIYVCELAVMKAGCAFIPVDPEYPESRVRHMLADSAAAVILTSGGLLDQARRFGAECVDIDDAEIYRAGKDFTCKAAPDGLAYMIYTSGSTGEPKGVMIEHAGYTNICEYFKSAFGLSAGSKSAAYASFSFDVSKIESYPFLASGGTVYVIPERIRLDVEGLERFLLDNRITDVHLPTQLGEQFAAEFESPYLAQMLIGGEKMGKRMQKSYKIYNSYGPTETTIDVNFHLADRDAANIPIGRPAGNVYEYILDKNDNLMPVGIPGELCVAGVQTARGYFKRDELTAKAFVVNPFSTNGENRRMYRTGDLARWNNEGQVEIFGRIDRQVKISGYRVELGEIEQALKNAPGVRETVVVDLTETTGGRYLCAYYTGDGNEDEMRRLIAEKLPKYMMPRAFCRLEALPLTGSGKVDRNRLPLPRLNADKAAAPPETDAQRKLFDVWVDVLGHDGFGIDDNFFEIGGTSLKAIAMQTRIRKAVGRSILVADILRDPTIRQLAERGGLETYIAARTMDLRDYPLTPAQEQMYVLRKTLKNETTYNIPTCYAIHGGFDKERLIDALNVLLERHVSLRTYFVNTEDGVRQRIADSWALEFMEETASEMDAGDTIDSWVRPFALEKPLLLRCGLLRLREGGAVFFLDIHHIIADGISISLLIDELGRLYNGDSLPDIHLDYMDYALWRQSAVTGETLAPQRGYWLNRLADDPPYSEILPDMERPPVMSGDGASIHADISGELFEGIKRTAASHGVSVFSIMAGAYGLLLSKYTASDDVIFGVPFSGRNAVGLEAVTGMFVCTLPLRLKQDPNGSVSAYLEMVKELIIQAQVNQNYPVADMVSDLNISRDASRNPLYSTVFNYFALPRSERGLKMERVTYGPARAHFDFTLELREEPDRILLDGVYAVKLYAKATIEGFLSRYIRLLECLAGSDTVLLKDISILKPEEEDLLKNGVAYTDQPYERDRTVIDLFVEQAAKTPDRTALVFDGVALTYRQLDEISGRIAGFLRKRGAGPEKIVGLLMNRSHRFTLCALGIMRAGGAYMPIDAAAPRERAAYMLEDAGTLCVIADASLMGAVQAPGIPVWDAEAVINADDTPTVDMPASPESAMIVLYTSGSTGKPKGAVLEHRNLVSFCRTYAAYAGVTEEDVSAAYASFAFDASMKDVYPFLLKGAAVHIIPEEIRLNLPALNDYFERNGITNSFMTTQMGKQFMENYAPTSLRCFDLGGERLGPWSRDDREFYNVYGPTECTIFTNAFKMTGPNRKAPIGKPLANLREYVVDSSLKLLPYGLPGELCVSGPQVSRGYLGRPDLNAEKFINNPFTTEADCRVLYRTGDLVRWLPDGNLEFLDRIDKQVKIRGYRVELGEIELKIQELGLLDSLAVVDLDDESGGKYLCCYYTAHMDADIPELKERLGETLPYYMIPAVFMRLDALPLNQNGKLDRRALPQPESVGGEYAPPSNDTEFRLCRIWSGILAMDTVGVNDGFFDLGGNSIKAVTLQVRIQKEFGVVLPMNTLMRNPAINKLAVEINTTAPTTEGRVSKAAKQDSYPVSPPQQQMYVLYQTLERKVTYNVSMAFSLKGPLDEGRLSQAIDALAQRHTSLRTWFMVEDGELRQYVEPNVTVKKVFKTCSPAEVEAVLDNWKSEFDLEKPPLIRCGLIRIGGAEHIFLIDAHHIILDGVSLGILMKDLMDIYNGLPLEDIALDYVDYAVWRKENVTDGVVAREKAFWTGMYADETPPLDLPLDFPRPPMQNTQGAAVETVMDGQLLRRLKAVAANHGTTLFSVLLGCYSVMLAKSAGVEDVVIGVPHSGRYLPELESVTGMFVNTLPIRLRPCADITFSQLIDNINELEDEARNNQNYSLSQLVQDIGIPRDLSRNPLFDVLFNYLQEYDIPGGEGLTVERRDTELSTSHFDMIFSATISGDTAKLSLVYATALFKKETAETFLWRLLKIAEQAAGDEHICIKDIQILSEAERRTILEDFNDTSFNVNLNTTICHIIDANAKTLPDNKSVCDRDGFYTYLELKQRTNALAAKVAAKAGAGEFVAVLMPRVRDVYVCELAVMKAGCAFIPIDPEYPEARIKHMLEDSGARLLLTTAGNMKHARRYEVECIDVSDDGLYQNVSFTNRAEPKGLAYMIYTSGSTGTPKGVMIEHAGLVNICEYFRIELEMDDESRGAPYASLSFDMSKTDSYPILAAGGQIHIVPEDIRIDMEGLTEFLIANQVTHLLLPTQFGEQFMADFESPYLKMLQIGGEKMRRYIPKSYKLYNGYGPTETTVVSNFYLVDRDYVNIPIGPPTGNLYEYILDKYNNIMPVGVPGELCIAGVQVARGYYNRDDLTAKAFVENPYATCDANRRMYRTGDLARWNNQGAVECLGRIDRQVKIRGFRIELGEIEQVLNTVEGIRESAVIDLPDKSGGKFLCAYYVGDAGDKEMRQVLSEKLPSYMVPQIFYHMDALPLTGSGKVDRNRLPEPEYSARGASAAVAPETEPQRKIFDAWKEVLSHEDFGIDDNFFEVGGTSLKAIRAVTLLKNSFDININTMYKYPTIRELANNLKESESNLKELLYTLRQAGLKDEPGGEEAFADSRTAYLKRAEELCSKDLETTIGCESVLLCGGTGFLGAFLLRELLVSRDWHIHAIVRGKDDADAADRLEKKMAYYFGDDYHLPAGRVTVWRGDLTQENLGMSLEDYQRLANNVDAVLNAAANVRHYGKFEDFYASNVQSVKNLIDFCKLGRNKRLGHVSTMSVSQGVVPGKGLISFSEEDCNVGQDIGNVYVKTKLMAEEEALAAAKDIDVHIYRVGNITPDSVNGRMQENIQENGFFSSLRSMLALGVIPRERAMKEFSHVDRIAAAITLLFDKASLKREIFHIHNPNLVNLADMLTVERMQTRVTFTPVMEFMEYLAERVDFTAMRDDIETIMLHSGWLDELSKRSATRVVVWSDMTKQVLARLGFEWGGLTDAALRPMIRKTYEERARFLASVPLFSDLKPERIQDFAGLARYDVYKDGGAINGGRALGIVHDGLVEQSVESFKGWTGTVRVEKTGGIIAYANLGETESKSVYEALMGDAGILWLDSEDMRNVLISNPDVSMRLIATLARNVENMQRIWVDMG